MTVTEPIDVTRRFRVCEEYTAGGGLPVSIAVALHYGPYREKLYTVELYDGGFNGDGPSSSITLSRTQTRLLREFLATLEIDE